LNSDPALEGLDNTAAGMRFWKVQTAETVPEGMAKHFHGSDDLGSKNVFLVVLKRFFQNLWKCPLKLRAYQL